MGEFNVEEFLVREMKDLNKKLDENTISLNKNINDLKTCIHNKVDEIKTEVNDKFTAHAQLHLNNAKSFISTKLFIFSLVIILGCMGTVFTLANNNRNYITAINTQHELEKKVVADENRLFIEDED